MHLIQKYFKFQYEDLQFFCVLYKECNETITIFGLLKLLACKYTFILRALNIIVLILDSYIQIYKTFLHFIIYMQGIKNKQFERKNPEVIVNNEKETKSNLNAFKRELHVQTSQKNITYKFSLCQNLPNFSLTH